MSHQDIVQNECEAIRLRAPVACVRCGRCQRDDEREPPTWADLHDDREPPSGEDFD